MTDVELNIEQMIQSERAWEFVLLDIVKSEDLDPWDIDITKLTAKYTERINKMKNLDLRIPARIILAAAILLKMKSDRLFLGDESGYTGEDEFGFLEEDDDLFDQPDEPRETLEDVPDLDIHVSRKQTRPITLGDLIDKLKKSMEPSQPRVRNKKFRLELPDEDISEKIEAIYKQIIEHSLEKVPFDHLVKEKNRRNIIDIFLPLLHLANEHKVDLHQEAFFKEVFVSKVPEDEQKKRRELKITEEKEPTSPESKK